MSWYLFKYYTAFPQREHPFNNRRGMIGVDWKNSTWTDKIVTKRRKRYGNHFLEFLVLRSVDVCRS